MLEYPCEYTVVVVGVVVVVIVVVVIGCGIVLIGVVAANNVSLYIRYELQWLYVCSCMHVCVVYL